MKVTLTNMSRAPMGIHGASGRSWVAPGATATISMFSEQAAKLENKADLVIEGAEEEDLAEFDRFFPPEPPVIDNELAGQVEALTERATTAETALTEAQSELASLKRSPALLGGVVLTLDHANDALWTGTGLPAVDAVKEAAGVDVSRADIEAAAPDFNREAAKAKADETAGQ